MGATRTRAPWCPNPAALALLSLLAAACAGTELYDFDGDGTSDALDCAPEDSTIHPLADDLYGNGLDEDCDGVDGSDNDGDGHALQGDDCDDTNPAISPSATETCGDGLDNDCDEATSDVCFDADADGYGAKDDCDDTDPHVYPEAGDTFGDGTDSDCDGLDCNASATANDLAYFANCQLLSHNWEAAQAACKAAGYDGLATITSQAEQELLFSLEVLGESDTWIGLNDREEEGSWTWLSGRNDTYRNWSGGEPNNGNGGTEENCAHMTGAPTGAWNDQECSATYVPRSACERR